MRASGTRFIASLPSKDDFRFVSWSTPSANSLPNKPMRSCAWVVVRCGTNGIWMRCAVAVWLCCWKRARRCVSIADRPRVTDTDDPVQDSRTMWRRSRDRYVAAADYVYRSDKKTVAQEVADLTAVVTGDSRFTGVLSA